MSAPTDVTVEERAAAHPKFSPAEGGEPPSVSVRKPIDTGAARERITTTTRTTDRAPRPAPRTARAERPADPLPTFKPGLYRVPVAAAYSQIGATVAYVAYPLGVAIQQQAGPCAEAWEAVAKNNPAIQRWLLNMTKGSAYGNLLVAHLPILMTAVMTFGPDSVKERFGMVLADSFERSSGEDQPNTP